MSNVMNRQDEYEEVDLREIFRVLADRKWLIISLTLTALLVAGVISFFILPPVYEAQTTLLVLQGDASKRTVIQPDSGDLKGVIANLSRLPEMTLKTYVEQIKDPVLLSEVMKKMDLTKEGDTVQGLSNMIQVTSIKDTNLIEVRVQNTDPQKAEAITTTLSGLLMDSISKNTQEQMSKSVVFLQEQANLVSKDLATERDKLKELEARPRNTAYLEAMRESSVQDLAKLRSSYLDSQLRYQQAKAGLDELTGNLANTSVTATDGSPNPTYQSLKEQIAVKNLIVVESRSQMNSLSSQISRLENQLDSLQVELSARKSELQDVESKASNLEKAYALLSEKITQTQITKSVNLGDTSLQIISPTTLQENPVKPNKRLNLAIAGLLGLLASLILAYLLELLDNKFRTKEDVEKHLGLAVLGVIPKFAVDSNLIRVRGKGFSNDNQTTT